MSGITSEIHEDREIMIIDFSDCKEDQMIVLMTEFRNKLIAGKKMELILTVLNEKSYITPKFMKAFREGRSEEAIVFIQR